MTQPVPAQELPAAPRSASLLDQLSSHPQLADAFAHWLDGRFAEVVALVRPLAQQEDPVAQYLLGKLYSSGEGVPVDEEQAIEWWRMAAEQGLAAAQNELGVALADGWGVERDPQQAVAWMRKAAEQGMTTAQVNLGLMYLNGVGVRRSETEAVRLFRQAAEQGMGWAQYYLGIAYAEGRGVTPNRTLAVQWTRRAAEQDYTQAQVSMGVFYMQGQAVRRDEARAIYWFARAAKHGDEPAGRQLKRLLPRLRNMQLPIGTNVLSAPAASSAIVVTAEANEPAYVLERRDDWVEVYLERGHSLGFVSREAVPGQQGTR
jgi:TPR repeat protein